MKIRTITVGLPGLPTPEAVCEAGKKLGQLAEHFQSKGYVVQSRRIAFEHWDNGLGNLQESDRSRLLSEIDSACADAAIDFCSLGVARRAAHIEHMAEVLLRSRCLNGCAEIVSTRAPLDEDTINAAAAAIRYLASGSGNGFGNFRFGAGCSLAPGTPFFPGSYHDDIRMSFSIGFENSDILVDSFRASAASPADAEQELSRRLSAEYVKVAGAAESLSETLALHFKGLDTSIVPSVTPEESIVEAFGALGTRFGSPGTLALCSLVTAAVKCVPVRQVGYCGIMLPVLEDVGLADAATQGRVGITGLIAWSSVCGVGVDMVPLPGDTDAKQLAALIRDVGTMSLRLTKPLSVRVLPIPGRRAGEITAFDSPYVCNAAILPI
jgi:uncharacterized protein (UPF0210 family)